MARKGDRSLSNGKCEFGEWRLLTSSSSRSMAESAFMMEPLSDSMEEEILPAPRRSVGLQEKKVEKWVREGRSGGNK